MEDAAVKVDAMATAKCNGKNNGNSNGKGKNEIQGSFAALRMTA